MNPYDELGIPADASQAEIKAAHRKRAMETHPDHGGDPEAFERVQRASLVLRDPRRREKYDRTGETEEPVVPDQHKQAIDLVSQVFCEVVANCRDLATLNVMQDVGNNLAQMSKNQSAEEHLAHQQISRLKGALKRLKYDGKGPNFLATVLQQQIDAIDRAIEQMGQRLATIAEARELAKDFSWQHEEQGHPIMQEYTFLNAGSASTWR